MLSFYGNDGVCIFKYLVTRDDPQWAFSMAITVTNFLCFMLIAASYIVLAMRSKNSARNVGQNNRMARKNQQILQRKVTAIILTDFLCWIPLCTVSYLHWGEVIDASPWYSYFATFILPINSVINPLLYDRMIFKYAIGKPIQGLQNLLPGPRNETGVQTTEIGVQQTTEMGVQQTTEMRLQQITKMRVQ